ncbi:MAG: hypothetical protein ACXV8Q_00265 [Methylobacter sp.]
MSNKLQGIAMMNQQNNEHPESVQCGFCGYETEWGYTVCRGCGARIAYGLNAHRIWSFMEFLGWGVVGLVILFAGIITMIATAKSLHTGAAFLDMAISLSCTFIVGYGIFKIVDKLSGWIVKASGLDKLWRNKYIFYRAS